MLKDLQELPAELPVPVDDGACDHLTGMSLPSVELASTSGATVNLANQQGTLVVYCYPMTGRSTHAGLERDSWRPRLYAAGLWFS